jgi:hypothetical protein
MELLFDHIFMYNLSITSLFKWSYYGYLGPQTRNCTWYLHTIYVYILLFIHKEWLGCGESSVSTTWFRTYPSIFANPLMLHKSWDLFLQSCTQSGPLFTAYVPPLTPLTHGLIVRLSNLAYWVFIPKINFRTEKDPVYGMFISFFILFKHARIGKSQ